VVTPSLQFITLPFAQPFSGVTLSFTGTPLYISPFSKKWHHVSMWATV
jgi:hypothetical protein